MGERWRAAAASGGFFLWATETGKETAPHQARAAPQQRQLRTDLWRRRRRPRSRHGLHAGRQGPGGRGDGLHEGRSQPLGQVLGRGLRQGNPQDRGAQGVNLSVPWRSHRTAETLAYGGGNVVHLREADTGKEIRTINRPTAASSPWSLLPTARHWPSAAGISASACGVSRPARNSISSAMPSRPGKAAA